MLLVDTNIAAYLLIEGEHTTQARELYQRDGDWRSEAFLIVEFTNVLTSSVASRRMTSILAHTFLASALALFEHRLVRVAHSLALKASLKYRVTAYDARFLALADQLGHPVITEDARLQAAAPKITMSLRDALKLTSP